MHKKKQNLFDLRGKLSQKVIFWMHIFDKNLIIWKNWKQNLTRCKNVIWNLTRCETFVSKSDKTWIFLLPNLFLASSFHSLGTLITLTNCNKSYVC